MRGRVVFVGAGPGLSTWLTLAGYEALRHADVILVDALVSPAMLSDIAWDAEIVDVGKRGGEASSSQDDICKILIAAAQAGKNVVRLKGGDPGTFGRLTEEIDALTQVGIEFSVIPGITAASATAARGSFSLTDRDVSASLTLLTGHRRLQGPRPELDWEAASRSGTGAVYMGILSAAENAQRLIGQGVPAETPVLVAQAVTTPAERLLRTTLGELATALHDAHMRPPAIWIYGDVVRGAKLEATPLRGVVATFRPFGAHLDWHAGLREAGWEPCAFPLQRITEPQDGGAAMAAVLAAPPAFLAWTSPTAVKRSLAHWQALGFDLRSLAGWQLLAVGPATAAAIQQAGLQANFTTDGSDGADGFISVLPSTPATIYFLQAEDSRETPLTSLAQAGWRPVRVATHRKQLRSEIPGALRLALDRKQLDAAVWTATSQVQAIKQMDATALSRISKHVAIGQHTAAALREAGVAAVVAERPDLNAVLAVL